MKTRLLTLALAGVMTFAGTFHAAAVPKVSPTPAVPEPTPGPRTARPLPFTGKIFSIDTAAKTFSTQNHEKKIRVFEISSETKITKKNSTATFDDLKPGDEVRGMALPKGDGRFETESVTIGARRSPSPPLQPRPSPPSSPLPNRRKNPTSPPPRPPSARIDSI